jgi:hypothetical protein
MKKKSEARFWVWHRGEMARLKISAGQTLTIEFWERTDEGYHAGVDTFFFDGREVFRDWQRDGRDCDGRLTHSGEASFNYHTYLHERRHTDKKDADYYIFTPNWDAVTPVRVYDENAQAAGY